jgi:triosephosphate isomerase
VSPENAPELFAQPDIVGGLIGGASLNADLFVRICKSVS